MPYVSSATMLGENSNLAKNVLGIRVVAEIALGCRRDRLRTGNGRIPQSFLALLPGKAFRPQR